MASAVDILQEMIRQRNARADSTQNAVSETADSIKAFGEARQRTQQNNLNNLLVSAKIQQLQTESENQALQSKLLNSFLKGADPTSDSGGLGATKATIGGVTLENLGLKQKLAEQKDDRSRLLKARKDLDTFSSSAESSILALNKIEEQARNLPEFQRGFLNQIGAKATTAVKEFSKDKDLTRFIATVEQELIPIARNLAEEKGPINEADIARLQKGLTDTTTPFDDKVFALNQFRRKLQAALAQKFRNAKISGKQSKKQFPGLSQFLTQDFKTKDSLTLDDLFEGL